MTSTETIDTTTVRNLRVLLANEEKSALHRLAVVVRGLGHDVTPYAVSVTEAIELIAREDPQLAIVMIGGDDEHGLSLIGEAVEYASGPVIAVLRDADADFLSRAAELGIAAFVESSDPEAVQGAIEVAVRRYREESRLHEKVEQLQTALERRGAIERAKGILMERHGASEREAFELMRGQARSSGHRVIDVAQAVLDGHALLPRRP
jgi:AmiR/NasT family two-component response regulator